MGGQNAITTNVKGHVAQHFRTSHSIFWNLFFPSFVFFESMKNLGIDVEDLEEMRNEYFSVDFLCDKNGKEELC